MKKLSRKSAQHLTRIGSRNFLLTALAAATTDQLRLISLIAPDVVPVLPFPDESERGTFRNEILATNKSLFEHLDGALAVLRQFAGQKVGEKFFADLNYCFLILFRHAGQFAQGDPLACAYNRYQEMCTLLRDFKPKGENWNALRGAYDEFKESTTRVVRQLADLHEDAAKSTFNPIYPKIKIGPHCRPFLTECNRNFGSIILGKTSFHIPSAANVVWDILEKLIASPDPEGFVYLGNSSWQGCFSRTDSNNNRQVKCGCVQILRYIHPRHRGRGNGGWYRLMPIAKKTRTGDGTLADDV